MPEPATDNLAQAADVRLRSALGRVLRSLVFRGRPDERIMALPLAQLRCLHVIAQHEGARVADVAGHLQVKLPATSQIVDRLVKRGMVLRETDPHDRRVYRLSLTDQAKALLADGERHQRARTQAALALLTPGELERAAEGMELLARAAEAFEAREHGGEEGGAGDDAALTELLRRERVEVAP